MTRSRRFGSDVPFMAWFRDNERLPSNGRDCGIAATDVDLYVHRFLCRVGSEGTRDAQGIMMIEVKTREGEVGDSQRDTLWKIHVMSVGFNEQICVRHFGVSVLRMVGVDPSDTEMLGWGRFDRTGKLNYKSIDVDMLERLVRFEVDPDNLNRPPLVGVTRSGTIVTNADEENPRNGPKDVT